MPKQLELPYNQGLHRFAIFTATVTLLLIVAGALVTSNDAGLSVPDWPTTFGSFYKMPHMVGGVKYEHGHRMVAEFVGLLTIILAVWTWRAEKRRWLRILALGALGTVILQGILGGLTVLFYLPAPISSAHAAVAQTFLLHRSFDRTLHWTALDRRTAAHRIRYPPTHALHAHAAVDLRSLRATGAGRHVSPPWHELVAARGARRRSRHRALLDRHPRHLCLLGRRRRQTAGHSHARTMVAQLCLGFFAFVTRVMWGKECRAARVAHGRRHRRSRRRGSLVLATTVVLAIQVWRHVPVSFAERAPGRERKPVAA